MGEPTRALGGQRHAGAGTERAAEVSRNGKLWLTNAGPAVCVQAKAWLAFAIVRSKGVHTSVLAAPVVDLALVNICKRKGKQGRKFRGAGTMGSKVRIIYPPLTESRFEEQMQRERHCHFTMFNQSSCLRNFLQSGKKSLLLVSHHKPSFMLFTSRWSLFPFAPTLWIH